MLFVCLKPHRQKRGALCVEPLGRGEGEEMIICCDPRIDESEVTGRFGCLCPLEIVPEHHALIAQGVVGEKWRHVVGKAATGRGLPVDALVDGLCLRTGETFDFVLGSDGSRSPFDEFLSEAQQKGLVRLSCHCLTFQTLDVAQKSCKELIRPAGIFVVQ